MGVTLEALMGEIRNRFIKALVQVTSGNAAMGVSALVVVMLATRFISIRDLGYFVILELAASVIEIVAGLGIRFSLVKDLVEDKNPVTRRASVNTCTNLTFVCSLVCILLALAGNAFLHYFPIGRLPLIFIGYCLARNFFLFFNSAVFQGLQEYGLISKTFLVHAVLKVVFCTVAFIVFSGGIEAFLVAQTMSFLVPMIWQMVLMYRLIGGFQIFDRDQLRKVWSFGMPLYLNNLLSLLYGKGYTFLVAFMLSPEAVAFYNIATRIPNMIQNFQGAYGTVFYPTVIECLGKDNEKAAKLLRVSIVAAFGVILPGAFLFFLFRDFFVTLLFSSKYLESSLAAALLLARSAMVFCGPLMGSTLIALGQNKAPLSINLPTFLLTFALSAALIPVFGYMAVVYVSLFGSVLSFFLNYAFLTRSGIRLNLVWISTLFMSTVALFIPSALMGNVYLHILLAAAFLAFIFAGWRALSGFVGARA